MKLALLALAAASLSLFAADAPLAGKWKTYDEKTGKPKSIVSIYEENGAFSGKVEAGLDPTRAGRRCDACTDERKGQPIVGMVIIRNMKKTGDEFTGGDILDPENGNVYRCKLKLSSDGRKLTVRGFLGVSLFGRSQIWTREP